MKSNIQKDLVLEVFSEISNYLKTGQAKKSVKIALTTFGSEITTDDLIKGAESAMQKDASLEVVLIGNLENTNLKVYEAKNEDEVHNKLEELFTSKTIHGAVTMHYPFPIGVSTVGKVITPVKGKPMYIATTTGTSDTHRVKSMLKNTIYGISVAKADGLESPTIGILNIEGARQVERHLNTMKEKGFIFEWGQSQRSDGGHILRGNDLILGSVDVVVTDPLTGNILMKLFSSFNSGGNYETIGYGYGPGVGFDKLICIVSRASGTPVIAGAIEFCASMVRGNLMEIAKREIRLAEQFGINLETNTTEKISDDIPCPPEQVTDSQIEGIEILELEDAVKALWKNNIYATSGMGCTGPVVLVASTNREQAVEILKAANYL